jgi:hypothetical protein
MTDMRNFIRSLPNAAELSPAARRANESEIERRVRGLSATDREIFEKELRSMAREQSETMSFEQKWAHARNHSALKEQLTKS